MDISFHGFCNKTAILPAGGEDAVLRHRFHPFGFREPALAFIEAIEMRSIEKSGHRSRHAPSGLANRFQRESRGVARGLMNRAPIEAEDWMSLWIRKIWNQ
jgi:hypothetical protein